MMDELWGLHMKQQRGDCASYPPSQILISQSINQWMESWLVPGLCQTGWSANTISAYRSYSSSIGATTVWTVGRLVPQLLSWRGNNVLVPQLLGRSFQKARNFTASSHQNAGLSIWVFKNFSGVIPRTLTAPNTQPGLWPRCWDPNLGTPQLFSVGCAPVVIYTMVYKKPANLYLAVTRLRANLNRFFKNIFCRLLFWSRMKVAPKGNKTAYITWNGASTICWN